MDLENRETARSFDIDSNKSLRIKILVSSLRLLEKVYSRVTSPAVYNDDIHEFDFGKGG